MASSSRWKSALSHRWADRDGVGLRFSVKTRTAALYPHCREESAPCNAVYLLEARMEYKPPKETSMLSP